MVDVINFKELSNNEKLLVLSLQGIVNKKEPLLYLDIDNYLDYLTDTYQYITIKEALEKYQNYYKGGVLYNYEFGLVDMNIAASLSGILNLVMIDKELKNQYNIHIVKDITNLEGDYIDKQELIFDEYQHLFNKNGLIHQVTTKEVCHITLRDHGICNEWFCFYTGETEKAKKFRNKVLSWAYKNIAIFGWTTNEIDFVNDISAYGDYVVPADWSCNHSFLCKQKKTVLKQKDVEIKSDLNNPNKHYLTIVVSDGDNIQWLERDFSTTSTFGQRLNTEQKYILNFTISPTLVVTSPQVLERIYSLGRNNYFICGVSGVGYMNPCRFPLTHLEQFCRKTNELFKVCDLSVVTLLDNLKYMDKVSKIVDKYAKFGNIIGGVYEVDPNKYAGAKGKIYYPTDRRQHNKPFASVRVSFWSNDGTKNSVTKEWIESMADQINNFETNIYSKNGYTVLNVHPWSTTIEHLDYLVNKLDSHIEIVKCDDFLKMIKNNIR